MIIRIIFIVITTLLSNSLLASSNNANDIGTAYAKDPTSFVIVGPLIPTGTADFQINSSKEYHTFEPGKEPPITVWTQFPGPKSNVDKPTVFTSKPSYSVGFASSGSERISKESIEIPIRKQYEIIQFNT